MTTLFFATDIHGSDICWNKFLNAGKFYGAEVLILGGDMTGKAVVPFLDFGGGKYQVTLLQQEFHLEGDAEYQEMVKRVRSRGYYPCRTTPDELTELSQSPDKIHEIFIREVLRVFEQWMETAARKLTGTGIRVYVSPGNDDQFEVDEMIRQSPVITLAESRVIVLD